MVHQSIYGTYNPYSWWHREVAGLPRKDINSILRMCDVDAVETDGGLIQSDLDMWAEYNRANGALVVGLFETLNIEERSAGGENHKLPDLEPVDEYKADVLSAFDRKTPWPVFVTWADWATVDRDTEGRVTSALPGGFYVRQWPDRGERGYRESGYVDFLAALHMMPAKEHHPFECFEEATS